MQFLIYPFLKLYQIIFPDAGRHAHDTLRFLLFTVLIAGLLFSGVALALNEMP